MIPLFLLLAFFLCESAFAVPASPFPITVKNPDGSIMVIRKVGNENLHYTVTEDNELIVRDTLGFWNYADSAGKSTGVRAHRPGNREKTEREFLQKRNPRDIINRFIKSRQLLLQKQDSVTVIPRRKSAPLLAKANTLETALSVAERPSFDEDLTRGEPRVLVILVEFSDVKFQYSTPQQDFLRYMNEDGYSENGMRWSVREYYVANSMGVFKPKFDVAAPVTLSKSRSYYGTQKNPDAAFTEAISLISQRGDIDFSVYDNDHDKYVDYVYMIYAGVGSSDSDVSDAIWPQAGSVYPTINLGSRMNPLYVSYYACSGEINGMMYSFNQIYRPRVDKHPLAGIGVFVHEYGHVLGLPDFYDVTDSYNYSTPVIWSLMDMGEYNTYPGSQSGTYNPFNPMASIDTTQYMCGSGPPRLGGFERYSLGWLTPRVLTKVNGEVTLRGIDQNDAIVIPSSNKKEYFMLDYRAKYDSIAPMPNSGLLVWRISYDSRVWSSNQINVGDNLRMSLIRADNDISMDSENYASQDDPGLKGDPFPGRKNVREFSDFVTYAGENLGLRIYDITETDSAVTFKVKWDGVEGWPSSSSVAESSSSSSLPESSSSITIASSSSSETTVSSSSALPFGISSSSDVTGVIAGAFAPQVHMSLEGRTLHVVAGVEGEKELRLFDLQGHQLHSERFTGKSATLVLERFGHGAFIVRLTSGNRVLAVKRL